MLLRLSVLTTLLITICAAPSPCADDPNAAAAMQLVQEGERLSCKQHFREALPYYYRASQISPTLPDPYFRTGENWIELDELKKGIAALTKAIELDPKRAEFFEERSKAYFGAADYDHALSDINRGIAVRPTDPNLFNMKGDVENARKDLPNALKDYTTTIDMSASMVKAANAKEKPGLVILHGQACRMRANVYQGLGNYQAAVDDYTQSLAASDGGVFFEHILPERAKCYDKLGKHDLAAKDRAQSEKRSHAFLDDLMK